MRKYTPGNVYGMNRIGRQEINQTSALESHNEFICSYRNVDEDMCAAIRIAHNAALDAERGYKKSKEMSSTTETSLAAARAAARQSGALPTARTGASWSSPCSPTCSRSRNALRGVVRAIGFPDLTRGSQQHNQEETEMAGIHFKRDKHYHDWDAFQRGRAPRQAL